MPASAPGADIHHDIARDIGQQVELMILEAKHSSESKVGKELQKIKVRMESVGEKIRAVTERVARLEPSATGVLKSDLQKSITKLEEMWEGEVVTLKHELWQTIQAHNHNADLLKHQKDAIDQIQSEISDCAPNPDLEDVHAQLLQVDKVMQRELANEQQMDQLMQRLTLVQQQLGTGGMAPWATAESAAVASAAAAAAHASAVATAGAGGYPPPAAGPAAGQAASKRAQRKVSKPTKPAPKPGHGAGLLGGPTLRAEAPEFVPTAAGWE